MGTSPCVHSVHSVHSDKTALHTSHRSPSTAMDTTVQPTADEAILFVSSMQAASNDSYQSTLQALKASTSRAVRAEMVDRIIDGAAILPSSTYQRFIVLLPHDTVAGSLRSLLPLVTPALEVSSSASAKVQVKSVAASNSSS